MMTDLIINKISMEIKIIEIKKFHIQHENKDVQDVYFEVLDDKGKTVEQLRQNFPMDLSSAKIKAELRKSLNTKKAEKSQRVKELKREAVEENMNQNSEELSGTTIS